jgi:hypothetical protein
MSVSVYHGEGRKGVRGGDGGVRRGDVWYIDTEWGERE